jgi:hypothetical protein
MNETSRSVLGLDDLFSVMPNVEIFRHKRKAKALSSETPEYDTT